MMFTAIHRLKGLAHELSVSPRTPLNRRLPTHLLTLGDSGRCV
jgi:hypothetical protein